MAEVYRAHQSTLDRYVAIKLLHPFLADDPEFTSRFLREAHAGAPLVMLGGVIEMGETEARLLQLLIHPASGELAATFQTTVVHATPREGQPFAWPSIARDRAEVLKVTVPEKAQARGLDLSPFTPTASLDRAEALNLTRIGLGGLLPSDCDVYGRMRAEQFIGQTLVLQNDLLGGRSQIQIGDALWTLRGDEDLFAGTRVRVVGVEGGMSLKVEAA